MRINQDYPDLKTILKKIMNKEDFYSKYINEKEKLFFLNNVDTIKFYNGNINEIVVIKKK